MSTVAAKITVTQLPMLARLCPAAASHILNASPKFPAMQDSEKESTPFVPLGSVFGQFPIEAARTEKDDEEEEEEDEDSDFSDEGDTSDFESKYCSESVSEFDEKDDEN